jgi:hypothetical protein
MKFSANLLLVSSIFLTNIAQAGNPADWIIKGSSPITDKQRYGLYSEDQQAYLRYKDRTGVNLAWSNDQSDLMQIERVSGGDQPLKCGEAFALFIDKEWIMAEKQTFGINLSSRTKNKGYFQWKFECETGNVPTDQPLTLSNNGSVVVGCKRLVGVNLCWAGDVISVKGQNYRKADAVDLVKKALAPKEILDAI